MPGRGRSVRRGREATGRAGRTLLEDPPGVLDGLGQPRNLRSQQVPSDRRLLTWGSAVTTTFKQEVSDHLARIWGFHWDEPGGDVASPASEPGDRTVTWVAWGGLQHPAQACLLTSHIPHQQNIDNNQILPNNNQYYQNIGNIPTIGNNQRFMM